MNLKTNSEWDFKHFCSRKCKKNKPPTPAVIIIICCLNKYYNFIEKAQNALGPANAFLC